MNESRPAELLFCLLNNKVSGGNRIILELANRSRLAGYQTDLHFLDDSGQPSWFNNHCTIRDSIGEHGRELDEYDFVFASNSSLIPMILPYRGCGKLVLISQAYESYCYGDNPAQLFGTKPPLDAILSLPLPIISTSKSIQTLLLDKVGRSSHLVPVATDPHQFPRHQPLNQASSPKRILAVGDYLSRFKGIFDLADALEILTRKFPVQLVLITQQKAGRNRFNSYSFPVEFHYCPAQTEIASIYASCHVYCCSSWYEGFGLPCLESFSVGVPVVSTDNYGIREFARPGENMLIAQVNCPGDLAEKLQCLLADQSLASKLVETGAATASDYTWDKTMSAFLETLNEISKSECASSTPPDRTEMKQLLENLERAGLFTPIEVERELISASSKLEKLCASVRDGSINMDDATNSLNEIRDQLQNHLQNPQASYYLQFKARFDLCQLLSGFENQKDWEKLLSFSDR